MTIEGVDYSFARPSPQGLAAAGVRFAVRYLSGTSKGVTAAEVAALAGAGIDVAVVYEGGSQGALGGADQGCADAEAAVRYLSGSGLDQNLPIYFAVDFDAQPGQFPLIDAYLTAAASVIGHARVGVYGSAAVVEHVQAANTASWFWQTYAWSGGRVVSGIHLLQYRNGQVLGGGEVDLVRAYVDSFGQHPATYTPPTPEVDLMSKMRLIRNSEQGTPNYGSIDAICVESGYHWNIPEPGYEGLFQTRYQITTEQLTYDEWNFWIAQVEAQRSILASAVWAAPLSGANGAHPAGDRLVGADLKAGTAAASNVTVTVPDGFAAEVAQDVIDHAISTLGTIKQ